MPKPMTKEQDGKTYKYCKTCQVWKEMEIHFYTKNVSRNCKSCINEANRNRNKQANYYYTPVKYDKRRKENKPPKDDAEEV